MSRNKIAKVDPKQAEIYDMLVALDAEFSLKKWETGFLESIADQSTQGIVLTENQYEKLREVFNSYELSRWKRSHSSGKCS